MTDREVMKLALEALKSSQESGSVGIKIDNAIAALRQALEQSDDAAWAKHLKEPMSEKSVHKSDTMERHVFYVCPQCYWTLEQPDPFNRLVRIMGTFDLSTGHADNWNDLLDSLESELRDVLGYYRETFKVEQECSTHPDAPHGFNRDASHNYGRYVCDCEGWEPPTVSQEPQTIPENSDDVAQEAQNGL